MFIIRGGDNIGRIIILELAERDSSAFEDILSFISRHPDLKKWELRDEPILSLPGLEINLACRKVYCNQIECILTTKEYDILCLLVANKGRVLTYEQMYERIWGADAIGNERRSVGYHIHNLRKKLYGENPSPPFIIESIREIGYRLTINS